MHSENVTERWTGRTVFHSGNVFDVDAGQVVEAFSVVDGKIENIGSDEEVMAGSAPGDEAVDLGGKSVIPGVVDAHQHIANGSVFLGMVTDVHTPPSASIEESVDLLRRNADDSDGWIIGAGNMLQETRYTEKRLENRHDLDLVSTDRPVIIFHGMHTQVMNSTAIERLNLTAESAPPGGTVEYGDDGVPNGVIREMHQLLPVPRVSRDEMGAAMKRVFRERYLSVGVTSVCELTEGSEALEILDELADATEPLPRIRIYITLPNTCSVQQFLACRAPGDLYAGPYPLGGIKMFADGGASSEHAAVYEDYATEGKGNGELNYSKAQMVEIFTHAESLGLQVLIHCAGDRAQDTALAAFTEVRERAGGPTALRHRIEHMGNIFATRERLEVARRAGVLAVPNAGFIDSISDGMIASYQHMKSPNYYNLKDVLDVIGILPTGSDSTGSHPENIDPLHSIQCAMTRKSFAGVQLDVDQKLSLMQAVTMVTLHSAIAGGVEGEVGSLSPGKRADFVIFNRNLAECDPAGLLNQVRVESTWMGGRRVYELSA